MKRSTILCVLLALLICFGLIPIGMPVAAAGSGAYEGQGGTFTWRDNGDGTASIISFVGGGDVLVPDKVYDESGAVLRVIRLGSGNEGFQRIGVFMNNERITSVTVPEGIEEFYGYTFYGCRNMTALRVPSTLKLVDNPSYAFQYTGLTDLSGFKDAVQLDRLFVDNAKLTNIYGISNLTNLTTLSLKGNQIQELDALKNLTNLTQVYLTNNAIQDISGLASLPNLHTVGLEGNAIANIAPLADKQNLDTLFLGGNSRVADASVLMDLPNLRWVELQGTAVPNSQAMELTEFSDGTATAADIGKTVSITPKRKVETSGGYVHAAATYTYSDPTVAEMKPNGIDLSFIPKAAGTTTVTATFGGISKTFTITVMDYQLGDIDGSGKEYPDNAINANDALLALRHSVKEINLADDAAMAKLDIPAGALKRANVTAAKDPKEPLTQVDASDALQILRYSVKEINSFY